MGATQPSPLSQEQRVPEGGCRRGHCLGSRSQCPTLTSCPWQHTESPCTSPDLGSEGGLWSSTCPPPSSQGLFHVLTLDIFLPDGTSLLPFPQPAASSSQPWTKTGGQILYLASLKNTTMEKSVFVRVVITVPQTGSGMGWGRGLK